jgi:L,D-transpeptidase catalytic domain
MQRRQHPTTAPLRHARGRTTIRRVLLAALAVASVGTALWACTDPLGGGPSSSPPGPQPSPAPETPVAADASAPSALSDGAQALGDAAAYDGPRIGALFLTTPVMSDMEWPSRDGRDGRPRREREIKSEVVGYIRQGGTVPVIPEPHKKPNCQEGWYELLSGGFLCGKYASLDMNHPRLKVAPHTPDMNGPLPYQYGVNLTNGTPLYKTVPSREDRVRLEPWLTKKPKPRQADDPNLNPYVAADALDAGVPGTTTLTSASASDPFGLSDDAGVPWYLRDYDGGKPTVTLDDLRGEEGSPLVRRMVKGFYLALDQEKSYNNTKWWRTTGGLLAPFERVYVTKPPTEYRGVWLKDDAPLPVTRPGGDAGAARAQVDAGDVPRKAVQDPSAVGFVLWTHAHKYAIGADKKKAIAGEGVARFSIVRLTGETASIAGYNYDETDEGWWLRTNEGTRTRPGPAPHELKPGEKWVDVNLTAQTLVAYEGDRPVYATIVSSGRRNLQDKEKDHPTPKGSFRIREKHIAATMDGDVASDGPYSIEDVPWIMYFSGSYALHGAFWHSNFGHTQSHGCVNLAPEDARRLFGWTEPQLPDGWHGVVSTEEKPGTLVVVHD